MKNLAVLFILLLVAGLVYLTTDASRQLTSLDTVEAIHCDKARGRVVGSDLYLTKPFTREELLLAVKQHAA